MNHNIQSPSMNTVYPRKWARIIERPTRVEGGQKKRELIDKGHLNEKRKGFVAFAKGRTLNSSTEGLITQSRGLRERIRKGVRRR